MNPTDTPQPPAPWVFRVVAVTIIVTITAALFFGWLVSVPFAVAGLATAAAMGVDL